MNQLTWIEVEQKLNVNLPGKKMVGTNITRLFIDIIFVRYNVYDIIVSN